MKVMIDISNDTQENMKKGFMSFYEKDRELLRAILEGEPVKDWLSTFNTDSVTECFEAIQELKKKVGM